MINLFKLYLVLSFIILLEIVEIICFLGNSDTNSYEWWLGDYRRTIIPNTTYYVDTTKVHRTHSWKDDSYHLILNVPKTWENVIKLTSILENP